MPLSGACSASGRSERTEGMETGAFIEAPQARRSHGLSPDARQAQRATPSWQASRRLFSPRWPCDDLLALAPHAGTAFSTSLPIMGRLAIPVCGALNRVAVADASVREFKEASSAEDIP